MFRFLQQEMKIYEGFCTGMDFLVLVRETAASGYADAVLLELIFSKNSRRFGTNEIRLIRDERHQWELWVLLLSLLFDVLKQFQGIIKA